MDKYANNNEPSSPHCAFEQYPWAAIHNGAITWLTNYMEEETESVIKQFDDRILLKVAKDHLILSNQLAFS